MRYILIFLYGLLLPILATGQDVVISGVVKTESGHPIPYATIRFKQAGKGTVANQQGNFILKISPERQNDTIEFSSVGYKSETIAVLDASDKLTIILKEEFYDLEHVTKEAEGLSNIIKKAIENIPENFPQLPYEYPAFFRQYHLEEGKCVRLIEAAFDVYDPGYVNTTAASQAEMLKLMEMRRSKVYELNNGQHGNHLADLISENNVHYRIGTVLNEKALSFFKFSRAEGDNPEDDTKQVKYFFKNSKDEKVVNGTIWLKGDNFAIIRIEEETYPNVEYLGPWARNTGGYDWIFREGRKVIQYKEVEGKMYLDSISYSYNHDLVHPTFHTVDFEVEECFQLWCGEPEYINTDVTPPTGPKMPRKEHDLYGKRYEYHPTFWENYPLYLQHPLDEKLKDDLEKKMPLQEQFEKSGSAW